MIAPDGGVVRAETNELDTVRRMARKEEEDRMTRDQGARKDVDSEDERHVYHRAF
jgi:hypothetical protein